MGGQTLYIDWPCRIRCARCLKILFKAFETAAGIYDNIADGGVKALTYRLSGSYLTPRSVYGYI